MDKKEIIFLTGPPGCGKSRYRKNLLKEQPEKNYKVVCFDSLLKEYQIKFDLIYSEAFHIYAKNCYDEMDNKLYRYLSFHDNIIFDFTNLTRKGRKDRLTRMFQTRYNIIGILFNYFSYSDLEENNNRRKKYGKELGEKTLQYMYSIYEYPEENEGFSKIIKV